MQKLTDSLLILAIAIGGAFLRAIVLVRLWGWFIVPTFALPEIGMGVAYGMHLIFSTFGLGIKRVSPEDVEPDQKVEQSIVYNVIGPLFLWGLGAIVHYST